MGADDAVVEEGGVVSHEPKEGGVVSKDVFPDDADVSRLVLWWG